MEEIWQNKTNTKPRAALLPARQHLLSPAVSLHSRSPAVRLPDGTCACGCSRLVAVWGGGGSFFCPYMKYILPVYIYLCKIYYLYTLLYMFCPYCCGVFSACRGCAHPAPWFFRSCHSCRPMPRPTPSWPALPSPENWCAITQWTGLRGKR